MTKITKEELKRSWELAECMRDEGMSDYGNAFNNSEMVLKLHALIEEMREALEFYGKKENWETGETIVNDKFLRDTMLINDADQEWICGKVARDVLERYFK